MEALRDTLQHRVMPITKLSYPGAWEERGSTQLLHHRATAYCTLTNLREDTKIKRTIIRELQQRGQETLDITPFVREYVQGFSTVHHELRHATTEDIAAWKALVLGAIARYAAACSEEPACVIAYHLDEHNNTIEQRQLFREGITHLDQRRTRGLPTNLGRWYVSNETTPPNMPNDKSSREP